MSKKIITLGLSGLLMATACMGSAYAAGSSLGDLSVTATIKGSCAIVKNSVKPMDFGVLTIKDGKASGTATSEFKVQCDNGTEYNIALGTGINYKNEDGDKRTMVSGDNRLHYDVYKDESHTVLWKPTTLYSDNKMLKYNGSIATYKLYGRIDNESQATAGSYSDTVLIDVAF